MSEKDLFYLFVKKKQREKAKENVIKLKEHNIKHEQTKKESKEKKGLLREASNWKESDWTKWFKG